MLARFLPQTVPFFKLLMEQNAVLQRMAQSLIVVMENTYESESHLKQINILEEEADKLNRKITWHLSQTFITPIDREDIHAINLAQERVADGIQNLASRFFIIVTYPDALAERVVAREVLKENTLKISVGEKLDNMFVSDVLDEYGFEQVDYVYEPGQYALRGSILDVFSFSYEFPYRIDFFGDEVETIRTFDVETQLSKEKLDSIYIVPEMSKDAKDSTSLLGSLPRNTFIAARDLAWCKERIGSVWNDDPVVADEESFADIDQMRKKLVRGEDFLREVLDFRRNLICGCTNDTCAKAGSHQTDGDDIDARNACHSLSP